MRIGPHEFSIQYDEQLGALGAAGVCNYDNAIISVDPSLSPTMVRDSLLHEIFHAAWKSTSLRVRVADEAPDSLGESIIQDLVPVILQVLRDNAEFVAWLIGED